jgi:hypothetical protein
MWAGARFGASHGAVPCCKCCPCESQDPPPPPLSLGAKACHQLGGGSRHGGECHVQRFAHQWVASTPLQGWAHGRRGWGTPTYPPDT